MKRLLQALSLFQWFSIMGDFVPQGTSGNVWIHFWLSQPGKCYWHPLSRGQKCKWTSCNAHDIPRNKESSDQNHQGWEAPIHLFKNYEPQSPTLCQTLSQVLETQKWRTQPLCLPEWPPTSEDSEAFLKGQDDTNWAPADHRGRRGTRKTKPSLPGGWREASERRALSISVGCWQRLWHWLLDSDFLGSNLDLTTQTSCAFRCYRTSLCLRFLICKTQKIILKMGIGWNIIGKGLKIVPSI